jgi:hypothetical protein
MASISNHKNFSRQRDICLVFSNFSNLIDFKEYIIIYIENKLNKVYIHMLGFLKLFQFDWFYRVYYHLYKKNKLNKVYIHSVYDETN